MKFVKFKTIMGGIVAVNPDRVESLIPNGKNTQIKMADGLVYVVERHIDKVIEDLQCRK